MYGGAIEVTNKTDVNNASFYYSVNMLKFLLKLRLISEDEYERIIHISALFYDAENIYV